MELIITSYSHIIQNKVIVNGRLAFYQENIHTFADFIRAAYKHSQTAYPKFYKMDAIGKLGFLGAELAIKERTLAGYPPERIGVVFANASSSLDTDMAHYDTIRDRGAYFPSPAVFVYTLPNIVVGEVCIRHGIKGENAFLIAESFDGKQLCDYVMELFDSNRIEACLCGWTEALGDKWNGLVALVEMKGHKENAGSSGYEPVTFNETNLNRIMKFN